MVLPASVFPSFSSRMKPSKAWSPRASSQPSRPPAASTLQPAGAGCRRIAPAPSDSRAKPPDEVRRSEARQLRAKGDTVTLKHSRWALLKRKHNLTEKQTGRLAELLKLNLRTVRAYLLKKTFHSFWSYQSPYWAGKFLDRWTSDAVRSRIEPMAKLARTLRDHRKPLLNWFRARYAFAAGAVEGLNLKARLCTRLAYGFRSYEHAEIALFHRLGKLPEPPWLTHKFA